jgi:glycosyltransferase involved in cell wall biosynthesis
VPYGVDLGTFTPPTGAGRARRDGSRFEAIFSGQMTQRKGLSYLLEGWRRFARSDARLTIVGQPVGEPRALAPYADLFRHVPHQTRPQLARLYQASDVFVFPTLLEGMGLVVLEAMACGLPVIVTANGPGDVVRDGIDGYVIPTRDPEAIAERLERLYRDPALREEMGRNAARRAAEFGWSAYTDKVSACLAALGAGSRAAPPAAAGLMPAGASLES